MADIDVQKLFQAAEAGDGCKIRDEVFGKPAAAQLKAFQGLYDLLSKQPKSAEPHGSVLRYGLLQVDLDMKGSVEELRTVAPDKSVLWMRIGYADVLGQFGPIRTAAGGGVEINAMIEIDKGDVDHPKPMFSEVDYHRSGHEQDYECASKGGAVVKKVDKNPPPSDIPTSVDDLQRALGILR